MEPACLTCERKLFKASGLLRCLEWKHHTTITRCSRYIGPKKQFHFDTYYGPAYATTLAKGRSGKE